MDWKLLNINLLHIINVNKNIYLCSLVFCKHIKVHKYLQSIRILVGQKNSVGDAPDTTILFPFVSYSHSMVPVGLGVRS